jgi:ABC-type dipeptide/oligopeptide/nickel transport system permease subunit
MGGFVARRLLQAVPMLAPCCAAIFMTVLCLYLVGDGLCDALDPRLKPTE